MNVKKTNTQIENQWFAEPLSREHMPRELSISLDRYFGRKPFGTGYSDKEKRIPDHYGDQQSMRGFEETYRNIIDYIVRITYKIWEDRNVEYIGETYTEDSLVYDDYGLQLGCKKIIRDTHHTTGAFSNIRLIADEVIWAGNDEIGFHTSHRTLIRGTNDGDSNYGPATNRDIDVLVIANCVALKNKIFLEHVLYNNSSMLQQLGMDINEAAARMARSPPAGWPRDAQTWKDLKRAASPPQALSLSQPISGFDVDAFSRGLFDGLLNQRNFAVLANHYGPGFGFQGPSNRKFAGADAYHDFLGSIFAAFPDLVLAVDQVHWMGNDESGYLSAVRWSATGTHTGDSTYGSATGSSIQIWGITQQKIFDGHVVSEWMLFNELDLMMQIARVREGD